MRTNDTFYGYVDYTHDGRPFYVGIGNERRIFSKKRNRKHGCISKQYGITRVIEFECSDWNILKAWEIGTISAYDTFTTEYSTAKSICCNFTKGGDGCLGYKFLDNQKNIGEKNGFYGKHHSAETKQLLSQKSKNNQNCVGRKHTLEAKMNMSKSQIGKKHSEKAKAKMRLRKHSDETKQKMSQAHKGNKSALGYKHTAETIKKLSDMQKARAAKSHS
jgi:NUMOD3 motif